jgi:hypothetical protein
MRCIAAEPPEEATDAGAEEKDNDGLSWAANLSHAVALQPEPFAGVAVAALQALRQLSELPALRSIIGHHPACFGSLRLQLELGCGLEGLPREQALEDTARAVAATELLFSLSADADNRTLLSDAEEMAAQPGYRGPRPMGQVLLVLAETAMPATGTVVQPEEREGLAVLTKSSHQIALLGTLFNLSANPQLAVSFTQTSPARIGTSSPPSPNAKILTAAPAQFLAGVLLRVLHGVQMQIKANSKQLARRRTKNMFTKIEAAAKSKDGVDPIVPPPRTVTRTLQLYAAGLLSNLAVHQDARQLVVQAMSTVEDDDLARQLVPMPDDGSLSGEQLQHGNGLNALVHALLKLIEHSAAMRGATAESVWQAAQQRQAHSDNAMDEKIGHLAAGALSKLLSLQPVRKSAIKIVLPPDPEAEAAAEDQLLQEIRNAREDAPPPVRKECNPCVNVLLKLLGSTDANHCFMGAVTLWQLTVDGDKDAESPRAIVGKHPMIWTLLVRVLKRLTQLREKALLSLQKRDPALLSLQKRDPTLPGGSSLVVGFTDTIKFNAEGLVSPGRLIGHTLPGQIVEKPAAGVDLDQDLMQEQHRVNTTLACRQHVLGLCWNLLRVPMNREFVAASTATKGFLQLLTRMANDSNQQGTHAESA